MGYLRQRQRQDRAKRSDARAAQEARSDLLGVPVTVPFHTISLLHLNWGLMATLRESRDISTFNFLYFSSCPRGSDRFTASASCFSGRCPRWNAGRCQLCEDEVRIAHAVRNGDANAGAHSRANHGAVQQRITALRIGLALEADPWSKDPQRGRQVEHPRVRLREHQRRIVVRCGRNA